MNKIIKYSDEYFMRIALSEAKKAFEADEVPVGAVLVDNATHQIIAKSHNQKEKKQDITSHAEINVLRKASKLKKNYNFEGTTLYVTLEPCAMCGGAILQSRIERLVFGSYEPKFGAFGSVIDLTKEYKSKIIVKPEVLAEDTAIILNSFFENKRK